MTVIIFLVALVNLFHYCCVGHPFITSLIYNDEDNTLTCVSTGSPATNVTWMKEGHPLSFDRYAYQLTQMITDRATSTYSNVLTINEKAPTGVAGTYGCQVSNQIGSDYQDVIAVGEYDQNKRTTL